MFVGNGHTDARTVLLRLWEGWVDFWSLLPDKTHGMFLKYTSKYIE